jgi:hypothetical protein
MLHAANDDMAIEKQSEDRIDKEEMAMRLDGSARAIDKITSGEGHCDN